MPCSPFDSRRCSSLVVPPMCSPALSSAACCSCCAVCGSTIEVLAPFVPVLQLLLFRRVILERSVFFNAAPRPPDHYSSTLRPPLAFASSAKAIACLLHRLRLLLDRRVAVGAIDFRFCLIARGIVFGQIAALQFLIASLSGLSHSFLLIVGQFVVRFNIFAIVSSCRFFSNCLLHSFCCANFANCSLGLRMRRSITPSTNTREVLNE